MFSCFARTPCPFAYQNSPRPCKYSLTSATCQSASETHHLRQLKEHLRSEVPTPAALQDLTSFHTVYKLTAILAVFGCSRQSHLSSFRLTVHIIPTHVSPLPDGPADGRRCPSWAAHFGLCFLHCLHPFSIYAVACHVESHFNTPSLNSSQTTLLLLLHILSLSFTPQTAFLSH